MSKAAPFCKYDSLENHYQMKAVGAFADVVPRDEPCIFTEKVHGANVQVYVGESGAIRIARRGAFLSDNDNFYGIQQIVARQREQFEQVLRLCQEQTPDVYEVSVCGEVFGGEYPGLQSTGARVQRGVYYSNDRLFYAFDVRLFRRAAETPEYLAWSQFCHVMDHAAIFRAEELGRRSASEVCAALFEHSTIPDLSPVFASTIPARLGHPHIDSNFAEGYVIRTEHSYTSRNGTRMIFKYKNPSFYEVAQAPKQLKTSGDDPQWQRVQASFLDDVALRNRLANVLSKESWELSDNSKRGAIVKALADDVLLDVEKEASEGWDLKKIRQRLAGACSKFVASEITKER